MASKILPKIYSPYFRGRGVKPICAVEVDWSNPLSHDLVYAAVPNNSNVMIDLSSGEVISSRTTGVTHLEKKIFPQGVAVGRNHTGDSVNGFATVTPAYTNAEAVSGVFSASWQREDRTSEVWSGGSSGRTEFNLINTTAPKFPEIKLSNSAGSSRLFWSIEGTGMPNPNQLYTIAFSGETSPSTVTGYIDGVAQATNITTDTIGGAAFGCTVSNLVNSSTTNGHVGFLYLFDRVLKERELLALSIDPFQILKPKQSPVYFAGDAAPPSGFKPQFAVNSNTILQVV